MLGFLCDAFHAQISPNPCSKLVTKQQLFSFCTQGSSLKWRECWVKGLLKVIYSVNSRAKDLELSIPCNTPWPVMGKMIVKNKLMFSTGPSRFSH